MTLDDDLTPGRFAFARSAGVRRRRGRPVTATVLDRAALRDAAARLVGPSPGHWDVPCPTCRAAVGDRCVWSIDRADPDPDAVHAERWDRAASLRRVHGRLLDALVDAVAGDAERAMRRATSRHRTLRRHAERQGLPGFVLPTPAQVAAEAAR